MNSMSLNGSNPMQAAMSPSCMAAQANLMNNPNPPSPSSRRLTPTGSRGRPARQQTGTQQMSTQQPVPIQSLASQQGGQSQQGVQISQSPTRGTPAPWLPPVPWRPLAPSQALPSCFPTSFLGNPRFPQPHQPAVFKWVSPFPDWAQGNRRIPGGQQYPVRTQRDFARRRGQLHPSQ